jgi:3-dehydroquinate synthase
MDYLEQSFSVKFEYRVYFTSGLFQDHNTILSQFLCERTVAGTNQKILFVIDKGVSDAHPSLSADIRQYFSKYDTVGLAGDLLIVPGGEAAKNDPALFDNLVAAIDRYGIDRHSYLAAIGGGAVLDLAGYAAAVSHRGIRHIRMPTTVLAQNDSGVGVKNGINHFNKKNFLGTFAPPVAVFNDANWLATLTDRDWRSGIAEAVKVALIRDAAFFYWIEEHTGQLVRRDLPVMNQLIRRCAELHLQHIAGGDPFELGSSRPLDFGHWSAHKLEQLTEFEILHGEAVAMGIALDTVYSVLSGRLAPDKAERILQLLKGLGFALTHPLMQVSAADSPVLKGLQEFREHLGGQLTIMLLADIGKGEEVHEIAVEWLKKAGEQLKTDRIC